MVIRYLPIASGLPRQPHLIPDHHDLEELRAITQEAINVFLDRSNNSGEITGIGYWQTANGYTAIALYDLWSRSSTNLPTLQTLLPRVEHSHPSFINEFNDDSLWWANCCIVLYTLTTSPIYLAHAQTIQKHIARQVIPRGKHIVNGKDMHGAVPWKSTPSNTALNSISTSLYAELCASLATTANTASQRAGLLHQAKDSLSWILRCRYNGADAIVLDTIEFDTGITKDWTFSYTTAQTIAACARIFEASDGEEREYLDLAVAMARKSLVRRRPEWVRPDGILTEIAAYGPRTHRATQNNDAVGFKSVLVRSLAKLYAVLQTRNTEIELQGQIRAFVILNFKNLVCKIQNGKAQFGPWWGGPMDVPTAHSQMAVLDVMAAVTLVWAG